MAHIIIEVSNMDDASEACRMVARAIDNGYTNGIIGWSGDEWSIEQD